MIMLRKRMLQVVMAMFLSLGLALAWGKPALASNDELWAEVEAYADLYRIGADHVMADGVSIGGMQIGGMTLRQTVDALRSRQESMKATEIVLVFEGKSATYTMEQFVLMYLVWKLSRLLHWGKAEPCWSGIKRMQILKTADMTFWRSSLHIQVRLQQ